MQGQGLPVQDQAEDLQERDEEGRPKQEVLPQEREVQEDGEAPPKTTITLFLSASDRIGKSAVWKVRSGKVPTFKTGCLNIGKTTKRACPTS